MPAYYQGAPRVHSEDTERRRGAKASGELKARERADKAAYEPMMEEENTPKGDPAEKSTKEKKANEKLRTFGGGANPPPSSKASSVMSHQDGQRVWQQHAALCRARRMVLWYP